MRTLNYPTYRNYKGYRHMEKRAEIMVFKSLAALENVLSKLENNIKEKGFATLADYYKLTDAIVLEEDDKNYGWTNLLGCTINIIRHGYELCIPMPQRLNVDPKEEVIDLLHSAIDHNDMNIVSNAIDRLIDTL